MFGIDSKVARSAWGYAAIFGGLALTVCVVWTIRKTLLVFATALLLAYLLYPLVDAIHRRLPWKSRIPAIVLPFALIFGLLGGFGFAVKNQVRDELAKLRDQITKQENGRSKFTQEVNDWKPLGLPIGEQIVKQDVAGKMVAAMPGLEKAIETGARYSLNFFIIPILSFFILKDGRRIRDALIEAVGGQRRAERIMSDAHTLLLEYMRALLLLALAVLVSFASVLTALHVRYAILLALAAFVLEFVPLVGPLTSGLLIVGVSEFNKFGHLWWLIGFLFAYRLFQDYVLAPHLMKKGVDLDPLLVIFGVLAGAEIGHVPGVFLSVPVLALLRLVYYEIRKHRFTAEKEAVAA